MRRFTAEYLAETRRGMWEDREALEALSLGDRTRILDVGCGSGELTRVLREESDANVVGVDADPKLLQEAGADDRVLGDAHRLPFRDGAFDLVVCQALLVNLPEPEAVLREFARVSSDRVAAIEPDNGAVTVDSTVEAESALAARAREAYIDGMDTDVTLGPLTDTFRRVGFVDVSSREYRHRRLVEPPYSEAALDGAARKARARRLDEQRETMLRGDLDRECYDDLRADWRAMGRAVIEQMQTDTYEREETIPFHVTVGRVGDSDDVAPN